MCLTKLLLFASPGAWSIVGSGVDDDVVVYVSFTSSRMSVVDLLIINTFLKNLRRLELNNCHRDGRVFEQRMTLNVKD